MATATGFDIREHMEVVCSANMHVGTVDHVEGDQIKLTKNDSPDGKHHMIPMSMVDHVDDKVHLNQHCSRVKQVWGTAD
jgi:hypothetical protein